MTKLIIKHDTYLKQSIGQAADLKKEDKVLVEAGKEFDLHSWLKKGSHYKVALLDKEYNELNTWYVFGQHCEILGVTQSSTSTSKLNAEGLALIKEFEGCEKQLKNGFIQSYKCPSGHWTIGYGTTKGVYPNQKITKAEAEKFLHEDVARFEAAVNKFVNVPLTSNQYAALVSFTYNLGPQALKRSTLLKKINSRQYKLAANEFTKWVYAGGQKLSGLIRRREAEKQLFLKP